MLVSARRFFAITCVSACLCAPAGALAQGTTQAKNTTQTPPARAATSNPTKAGAAAPGADIGPDITVETLFTDFLHFAVMGMFQEADAYAKTLLTHPDLDPVELLELADRNADSIETILILIKNSSIPESAQRVLDVIQKGEMLKRKDKERIQKNIEALIGNPQQEMFAIKHLIESGEHAVPLLLRALQDPKKKDIWPRVIGAMPQLGKAALNPMVVALAVDNNDIRINFIKALGELGYTQAVPYLRKFADDPKAIAEVKTAANEALARIASKSGRAVAGNQDDQFFRLGERYFEEDDTVRADPREEEANVWYWDAATQALNPVPVTRKIFGTVMAMRCCEEAVRARNDNGAAIALWLASNFRREARLGMNVESADPTEVGEPDKTRPENYPRAMYFAQAAGPRFLHQVLDRAVKDQDSAVALGAIEALRVTAGEASLVGREDARLSLTRCLQFPDPVVRIRAALALGAALPKSQFNDSQFVVPELGRALAQTAKQQLLIVDADEGNLNRVVGAFREGRDVVGDQNFFAGMNRARAEFQSLGGVFLSTDLNEPQVARALQALRGEFIYARIPVVILVKPGQTVLAEELAGADTFVETVSASADESGLLDAFERARRRSGRIEVSPKLANSMALQAAETLRRIVSDGKTVYDAGAAEAALIGSLTSSDEKLATAAASVLALLPRPTSQRALASVAYDENRSKEFRVSAFHALAESAKNNGGQLEPRQLDDLIKISRDEPDLVIRTAASQALGAANLSDNKASEIIRSFYGG